MIDMLGCAISGHCQLFKNPEARGKVIDAATTLGRTTGSWFCAQLHIHLLIFQSVEHKKAYILGVLSMINFSCISDFNTFHHYTPILRSGAS
jgi:hypothetical protein